MDQWHNHNLLVIDIQEKLAAKIAGIDSLISKCKTAITAASILDIPITLSEQYPKGLGKTVSSISSLIESPAKEKTRFSAAETITSGAWILCGIETHVCVLQTAKELLSRKLPVIVLSDCVASRNSSDHLSALQELRANGARVTTIETLLFEFLQDAKHPLFKQIVAIVK